MVAMVALAIPLEARAVAVVAMVVELGALHLQQVLLLARAAAAAGIAVGSLAGETEGLDRPTPSQTSAALAAAESGPHRLRVQEQEVALPLVFLVLLTAVDLEEQVLPLMVEELVGAPARVGTVMLVLMRPILHRQGAVEEVLAVWALALTILMVLVVAAAAAMAAAQVTVQVVGAVD
jgi:hypothetical protein